MDSIVDTSSTTKLEIDSMLASTFSVILTLEALFALQADRNVVMNDASVSFSVLAMSSDTRPMRFRVNFKAAVVFPVRVKFQVSSSSSISKITDRPCCDSELAVTFTTSSLDWI